MIKKPLLLVVVLLAYSVGVVFGHFGVTPRVEVVEKFIEIPQYVIVEAEVVIEYVDRVTTVWIPKYVTEEVIVEREVRIPLEHWDDLDELMAWLAEDKTDSHFKSYPGDDCDDQAYRLQAAAAEDGYFLSAQYIFRGAGAHMLNSAKIGNSLYFIEPQDDTVWLYVELD